MPSISGTIQGMQYTQSPRIHYFFRFIAGGLVLGLACAVLFTSLFFTHDNIQAALRLVQNNVIDAASQYYQVAIALYVLFIGSIIFLENKNPDSTMAWLVVLVLFPVLGVLCYWVIGPDLRYYSRRKMLAAPYGKKITHAQAEEYKHTLGMKTAATIYGSSLAPVHENCRVTLLVDGKETYDTMLEKIQQAKEIVLFQSFIIANDAIGETFKKALAQKAQEGLTVCLLYDAVGSWKISRTSVAALRKAGVFVQAFLPVAFPMLRGANYRNHRKTLIVDNEFGFMGGVNIREYYLRGTDGQLPWRDTHCMLQGTAVQDLLKTFVEDLTLCGAPPALLQKIASSTKRHTPHAPGTSCVQIATSGPNSHWDTIKKAYFSLITTAKKNIWITSPYLIPGAALQEALCTAALGGVDVRILIPGEPDHPMVFWASLHSCEELLRAGVRIYQYPPNRFIHAKALVCDSAVYSVGTANLDTRSLSINFESQTFMYDAALAKQGEQLFLADIANAQELHFAEWVKRPLRRKILENIGKLISPLA